MGNDSADRVWEASRSLTDDEKRMVSEAYLKGYGTEIGWTAEELSGLDPETLQLLQRTIQGILLTKAKLPNMREALEALQGTELPRRVEFGRISNDANPGNEPK